MILPSLLKFPLFISKTPPPFEKRDKLGLNIPIHNSLRKGSSHSSIGTKDIKIKD